MLDRGAEPALDAELGVLDDETVEFRKWMAAQFSILNLTPNLSIVNVASQPEEKKESSYTISSSSPSAYSSPLLDMTLNSIFDHSKAVATQSKTKAQRHKNIKRINEKEAEKINDIDAKIRKLNHDELKKKKEMNSNIASKRKAYDELKRKTEDKKHEYHKKIDEYDKKIQQQAKEKKEIEADIKNLDKKMAREENEMKKELELLRNNKQKLDESIRAITEDIPKQLADIKDKIKTLQKFEILLKSKLDANVKHMLNKLAVTEQEVDKYIKAIAATNKIVTRIQNMKEKEKELEKSIIEKENKLKVNLAEKRAEPEEYITDKETNTVIAMEQNIAEETIIQLKTFIKAATKDSTL